MENILICTTESLLIPEKKTPDAFCWDIQSAEDCTFAPWEIKLIPMGIKTRIPQGRCAKMYSRSSTAKKFWLILANGVGLIDSDYRGEYFANFYNASTETVEIPKYTRIAQIEFCPHHRGENNFGTPEIPKIEIEIDQNKFNDFAQLFSTQRGTGGFGSTGYF